MAILLIILSILDASVAIFAGAAMAFILTGGEPSGGPFAVLPFAAIVTLGIAGPIAGFVLRGRGRAALGLLAALIPLATFALLLTI